MQPLTHDGIDWTPSLDHIEEPVSGWGITRHLRRAPCFRLLRLIDAGKVWDQYAAAWLLSSTNGERPGRASQYGDDHADRQWLFGKIPHHQVLNLTRELAIVDTISARPTPIDPALAGQYLDSLLTILNEFHQLQSVKSAPKLFDPESFRPDREAMLAIARRRTNNPKLKSLRQGLRSHPDDPFLQLFCDYNHAWNTYRRALSAATCIPSNLCIDELGITHSRTQLSPSEFRRFARFHNPLTFATINGLELKLSLKAARTTPPKLASCGSIGDLGVRIKKNCRNGRRAEQVGRSFLRALVLGREKYRVGRGYEGVKEAGRLLGIEGDLFEEPLWVRVGRALLTPNPEALRWMEDYLGELLEHGRLLFPGSDPGLEERCWAALAFHCGDSELMPYLREPKLRGRLGAYLGGTHRAVGHDGRVLAFCNRREMGVWTVYGSVDSLVRLAAFRLEMAGGLVRGIRGTTVAVEGLDEPQVAEVLLGAGFGDLTVGTGVRWEV
jgi:hypothetical protein